MVRMVTVVALFLSAMFWTGTASANTLMQDANHEGLPQRPGVISICTDRVAAKMIFDAALVGNPAMDQTVQAVFSSGLCQPVPLLGMKDEVFNSLVKLTDTEQDWEGDPFAMFMYTNPETGAVYFVIIYNPDLPNNNGKTVPEKGA